MAIIKCPECNKEVSDKAAICPHCGFGVSKFIQRQENVKQIQKEAEKEAYEYVKRIKREQKKQKEQARINEENRINSIYDKALQYLESNKLFFVEQALEELKTIKGWKDSEAKIDECEQKIKFLKIKYKKDKKRNQIIGIIATIIIIVVLYIIVSVVREKQHQSEIIENYELAQEHLKNKRYNEALTYFGNLKGYKDADEMVKYGVYYQAGLDNIERKNYDSAIEYFSKCLGYKSVDDNYIASIYYEKASECLEKDYYENAIKNFEKCGKYENAEEMSQYGVYYRAGLDKLDNNSYEEALAYFQKCTGYSDTDNYISITNIIIEVKKK